MEWRNTTMGIAKRKEINMTYPGILLALVCLNSNCSNNQATSKELSSFDTIPQEIYMKYQSELADSIRAFMNKKAVPYQANKFDGTTEIIIDTILFSPTKQRIAFFVLAKNSNNKLLSHGDSLKYHYDGNCFIGKKNLNSDNWTLVWLDALNITRYDSNEEASRRIREMYFNEFNDVMNDENKSLYKYNLNDKRFWNGPVWQKYFVN